MLHWTGDIFAVGLAMISVLLIVLGVVVFREIYLCLKAEKEIGNGKM